MTGKQKIFISIAAVALILVAAIMLLWSNLDSIVKNAIEKYGSQAVGTAVRVSGVSLRPAKGKGSITGLTVANPKGYTAPHIISLGGISVRLSPRTVTENPVVIDNISITSPLIVYEMNEKRIANVDVLKKNLGADQPAKTPKKEKKDSKGSEKKIRIKRLVIENAKADVRVAALGKPRTVALSRIEMKNIGGRNGAPPEDVAKEIAMAIAGQVSKDVGKAGAQSLMEKGLERMMKRR